MADPTGSCKTTAPQAETTSAFTIKPTATDVTRYPGGVTAVVVEVGPGGTTKGNVTVSMEKLPIGLTVAGSYQGEVDYLKAWMTKRVAYMGANYLK
jgi:hypothetical protein